MIQIKCGSCSKVYQLPDQAAGKKVKCKGCGTVMSIPKGEEDPFELGGGRGPSIDALSALDDGDGLAPAVGGSLGFDPNMTLSTNTAKVKPLPMGLLLGLAGGAVGLIVIVVVAIVVLGGSGDDEKTASRNPQPGSGASTGSSTGTGSGFTSAFGDSPVDSGTGTDTDTGTGADTSGEPEDLSPGLNDSLLFALDQSDLDTDPFLEDYSPELIAYPDDDELEPFPVTEPIGSGTATREHIFRGVRFVAPRSWTVEPTYGLDKFPAGFMDSQAPQFIKDNVSSTIYLTAKTPAGSQIDLFIDRRNSAGGWPRVMNVKRMKQELVIGRDIVMFVEDVDSNSPRDHQGFKQFIDQQARKALNMPVTFTIYPPTDIFVHKDLNESITFGTLFGGYRFVRTQGVQKVSEPTHSVLYTGFIGDLQMTAHITMPNGQHGEMDQLESVLREAELVSRVDAQSPTIKDKDYLAMLDGSDLHLVFQDDTPPISSDLASSDLSNGPVETGAENPGATETGASKPLPEGLVTPTGKPYGILMPDGFEVASRSRVSVRANPLADGSWFVMEVHKLAGADRRVASPVDTADGTLLLRGHRVPMPQGVEVSELVNESFTIYRLLDAMTASDGTREVVYLVKDGPYLVTVRGQFPADDAERLKAYDAAARSIVKGVGF